RVVEQLAHPENGIIAPGTQLGLKPTGTGPFKFVQYQKGQRIDVLRNDAYWGQKARLEKLAFRFMPDANTRLLALQAGEVDMIFDLPREAVATLKSRQGFRIVDAPVDQTLLFYVNSHGKPGYDLLGDHSVRQALAMTIDHETIVNKVLDGTAQRNSAMAPASILGEFAGLVQGITYDMAGAQKLLDDAGWRKGTDGIRAKDGRRLTLTLVSAPTIDKSVLEFMQARWREAGIDAKLMNSPDFPSYQQFINNTFEFDLDAELPNQNDANPIFLPALRVYSKAAAKSAPLIAPGGAADRLIEEGLAATDYRTVQQKAAQAMHQLIDLDVAVIPIAGYFRIYAMKDKVQGFVPHPSQTSQPMNQV
ncbi:MAG: ABC transporter substrate-binding protein, partial [Dehalococcoidia bacterium]